jgi:radical SAM protein with 4Fe4S-binding SPASM domain
MNCDILTPEQFEVIRGLSSEDTRQTTKKSLNEQSEGLKKIIDKLVKQNAVTPSELIPVGIRTVQHPIPLPDGVLASPVRVYDTDGFGCNLSCTRCLNKSERARLDAVKRTLKQTDLIMGKFYDAGTMEWRITGGEPTVYPDIVDAIGIAKFKYGMAVMMNTNGCWDDKVYEPILNAGLTEIIISIEGSEKVNDGLRGEGVYQHIMRTLEAIKDHNRKNPGKNVRVTLNQTVGNENVQDVEHVVRLGAKFGHNVNFVPARPYGRAEIGDLLTTKQFMDFSENVQRLRYDDEVVASGIKIIHKNMDLFNVDMPDKRNQPSPFNYSVCGALSTGFGLSPDGRINACSFLAGLPEYTGLSLIDQGVTVYDAWLDSKIEKIRRAEKVGCTKCDYYMQQCEGKCIAMVLAEGGKIEDGKLIGRDRYCFSHLMKDRHSTR